MTYSSGSVTKSPVTLKKWWGLGCPSPTINEQKDKVSNASQPQTRVLGTSVT